MHPRRALRLAALALGVVALALLLRRWTNGAADAPHSAPSAPAAAPAPAAPPATRTTAPARRSSAVDAAIAALRRAMKRGEARPGEAVLLFRDDDALRRFLAQADAAGVSLRGTLPALRAVRVRADDPAGLHRALLATGDDAPALDPNFLVTLPLPPAREDRPATRQVPFGDQTLSYLGATGDRSTWGRGTTIALLDTGVATDPTFGSGRVQSLDIGLGHAPGQAENDGHGTAVAALAAGAHPDAPGIAPAANLLSIRVTDANATSDLFTLAQAIVTATDAGARVINISLGGHTTGPVLAGAIDYATARGALLVAAAGNDQAAQLAWPAADPRVLSVGAVDLAEQQVTFSNSGTQLKLSAPGYGVPTAWLEGQRVVIDGTSASAPLVAGAVATLLSLYPSLTPAQAADLLFRSANDAGQPGADPAFGHGILNLGAALNRNNPAYLDTAIASQFYDPARREMVVTVQNRGGRTVSGLTLAVTTAGQPSSLPVPSLAAGETHVLRLPVQTATSSASDRGGFTTTAALLNPPGATDAIPANNQRTTVTPPPGPP